MIRSFFELSQFRSQWEDLVLTDVDLIRLQAELLSNPKVGEVIGVTGGKIRFVFEYKGKSGGVRVIYTKFES